MSLVMVGAVNFLIVCCVCVRRCRQTLVQLRATQHLGNVIHHVLIEIFKPLHRILKTSVRSAMASFAIALFCTIYGLWREIITSMFYFGFLNNVFRNTLLILKELHKFFSSLEKFVLHTLRLSAAKKRSRGTLVYGDILCGSSPVPSTSRQTEERFFILCNPAIRQINQLTDENITHLVDVVVFCLLYCDCVQMI